MQDWCIGSLWNPKPTTLYTQERKEIYFTLWTCVSMTQSVLGVLYFH